MAVRGLHSYAEGEKKIHLCGFLWLTLLVLLTIISLQKYNNQCLFPTKKTQTHSNPQQNQNNSLSTHLKTTAENYLPTIFKIYANGQSECNLPC